MNTLTRTIALSLVASFAAISTPALAQEAANVEPAVTRAHSGDFPRGIDAANETAQKILERESNQDPHRNG